MNHVGSFSSAQDCSLMMVPAWTETCRSKCYNFKLFLHFCDFIIVCISWNNKKCFWYYRCTVQTRSKSVEIQQPYYSCVSPNFQEISGNAYLHSMWFSAQKRIQIYSLFTLNSIFTLRFSLSPDGHELSGLLVYERNKSADRGRDEEAWRNKQLNSHPVQFQWSLCVYNKNMSHTTNPLPSLSIKNLLLNFGLCRP